LIAKDLEFHPQAVLELEAATDWYLERSPHAARQFVEEITLAIDRIIESPQRWPGGLGGTRRLFLKRFPFAIVYREESSIIQVVAIAHGRRRPGYWRDRL
jgi:plasmid stabilization system protein ParE